MSHYPPKIMPPGGSRKRKETELLLHSQSPKSKAIRQPGPAASASSSAESSFSNWVLAGFMAYEFLNKGTLLGHKFDPNTTTSVGASGQSDNYKEEELPPSYAEVSRILTTDGSHIAGIVNPSQLTRWTHL